MVSDPGSRRGGRETLGTPDDSPTSGSSSGQDVYENALLLKMMHQLISDVGGLKEVVAEERRSNDGHDARITGIEQNVEALKPKIDAVHAFSQYSAPHLATKEDVANLKSELKDAISERPRLLTLIAIFGLIAAFLAIPFLPDWWSHTRSALLSIGIHI